MPDVGTSHHNVPGLHASGVTLPAGSGRVGIVTLPLANRLMASDWEDCYLVTSALVVVRRKHVAILNSSARVVFTLDRPPGPMLHPRTVLTVVELAARLGIDDIAALGDALVQARLTRVGHMEDPPSRSGNILTRSNSRPLGEVLSLFHAGQAITHLLAVTSDEAVWTGGDPGLAAIALGMFVARLPQWFRRAAYGSALAGPSRVIAGDLPEAVDLAWAEKAVVDPEAVVTLNLRDRLPSGSLGCATDALQPESGRLAVASSITSTRLGDGLGAIVHVSATAADPPSLADPFKDSPFEPTSVGGGATEAGLAAVKCLGEAVEFFVSAGGLARDAVHAAAADLDAPWVSPADIICYQDEHRRRLGVTEFDPDEAQWWVPGTRGGEPTWLPACLVVGRVSERPRWFHPSASSSSGVASHPILANAIRSAWLECVERDAFQRCRALAAAEPPARLKTSSLPAAEREILRTLEQLAEVTILVLPSSTGIPVILVRTDSDARVGFGCSAAHDPTDALRHALIEAAGQVASPVPQIGVPQEVRTPIDHAGLYALENWRSTLDWMSSGSSVRIDDVVQAPVEALPAQAAVYRFPATVPLPVHVVRVLDPALIPITFGYDADPDGRADFAGLWQRSGRPVHGPLDPHPLA